MQKRELNTLLDEKLDTIHELASLASREPDSIEAFKTVKKLIHRIVSFDAILLYINDPETKALIAPMPYNYDQLKSEELVLPYQEPIVQAIMGQRKIITRIEPEVGLLPKMKVELCLPLHSPKQFLGCLYLARSNNNIFLAENIKFIEFAAGTLAISLERTEWLSKFQQLDKKSDFWQGTLSSFLQAIPFPALIIDRQANIIRDINELFFKLTGLSRTQVVEKAPSIFIKTETTFPEQGEIHADILSPKGESLSRRIHCSPLDSKNRSKILVVIMEQMLDSNRLENMMPRLAKLKTTNFNDVVKEVALLLKEYLNFDYFSLSLIDESTGVSHYHDIAVGGIESLLSQGQKWEQIADSNMGWITGTESDSDSTQAESTHPQRIPYTLPVHMSVLLLTGDKYLGNLALGRHQNIPFSADDLKILRIVSGPIAKLIELTRVKNLRQHQMPGVTKNSISSENLLPQLIEKLKKSIKATSVYGINLKKNTDPKAIFDLMPEMIQQYLSDEQILQLLARLERDGQAIYIDTPNKFITEFWQTQPVQKLVFFQPFIIAPIFLQNKLFAAVVAVWSSRHTLLKEELDVITAFISRTTSTELAQKTETVPKKDAHRKKEQNENTTDEMDEFVHIVSHELKSPLQTVKSYATLLNDEYLKDMPTGARTCLERILINLDQMEKLIIDLLLLSRFGKDKIQREELETKQIVRDVLDSLIGLLKTHPTRIQIQKEMPRIFAHRTGIRQVFSNLVSNAIKFSQETKDPLIEIGIIDAGEFFEFYVRDNGMGIDPDKQDKVFDLFYTKSADKQSKGTGVGLALVKKIV
ncbi:GAF domain-containing protein, partial [candidate division KSB1 bacterium]|nr:GAF domain-containing protein [candidate division KSB1 bacterium]